jgi:hypothetical protein
MINLHLTKAEAKRLENILVNYTPFAFLDAAGNEIRNAAWHKEAKEVNQILSKLLLATEQINPREYKDMGGK